MFVFPYKIRSVRSQYRALREYCIEGCQAVMCVSVNVVRCEIVPCVKVVVRLMICIRQKACVHSLESAWKLSGAKLAYQAAHPSRNCLNGCQAAKSRLSHVRVDRQLLT